MAAIDRHRCRSGPTPDLAVPSDVLLPMDPNGQPVWIGLSDHLLLFMCWEIEDFYRLWHLSLIHI